MICRMPHDDSGKRCENPAADPMNDALAPPREPCECYCLHCNRVFMSHQMWFQRVINARDGFDGFWMCPTPNCDGAGFQFDIFPTDPAHPANEGWVEFGEDDEESEDEQAAYAEYDDTDEGEASIKEYDPTETHYRQFDELLDDEPDEDIEGEEWKYGLEPGAVSPHESSSTREARLRWEQEQKRYDEPDQRPRVVDWGDREDHRPPFPPGALNEDDIPF
jgi:hypothetical protein